MSSSGRPINPMTGQSNHGTFRKNGSGRLQWLFSFRFGVSVFGCVILFSLIILAMVLQRLRDENADLHRVVLVEHRNSLHAINQRMRVLEERSESLKTRVIESETRAANTSSGEGEQITGETPSSRSQLPNQGDAEITGVDLLAQQIPEEEGSEPTVAEPEDGLGGLERAPGNSVSPASSDLKEEPDSVPMEAHGSDPADEIGAVQESVKESPKPPDFLGYTVQPGDTLSAIARSHGVPLAVILEMNSIDNPNQIRVGSVLQIPSKGGAP